MSPREAKPDPSTNGPGNPKTLAAFPRGPVLSREGIEVSGGSRGYYAPAFTSPSSGPNDFSLVKGLKRQWLLACGLGILGAFIAAGAAWWLLAPKNVVMAQLHIASTEAQFFRDNPTGPNNFNTYQRTMAARIKHPHVLNKALKQEDVKHLPMVSQQPEPLLWLADEIKVEFQEGSEIVGVKMTGDDPAEVMVLINAITLAYLNEVKDGDNRQQTNKITELEKLWEEARTSLKKKRDTLKNLAADAGTGETQVLVEKQKGLVATFAELNKQLAVVQGELMKAQGKLAVHKAGGNNPDQIPIPDAVLEETMEADPLIKSHSTRIVQIQEEIDKFVVSGVRQNDGTLLTLRAMLQQKEKGREARKSELRDKLADRLRQRFRADYEIQLVRWEEEVATQTIQEKTLRKAIDDFSIENKVIGNSSTELEMLRNDIIADEKLVNRLGKELDDVRVESRRSPRISLYTEAALQKKEIKRQVLGTCAAPLLAVIGVCFGVSWWEYRARRIHSPDEIVKSLGLRVVGSVPTCSAAEVRSLSNAAESYSHSNPLLESIDAIRTVLLRDASVAATRIVMVTSARSGEGKTELAGHLAGSLARAGRRTLLVDCDLRTPVAHQLLEQTLQPGLSEILLEEINLPEAVRPATALEGLWLLPAGQWDREVVQALAQDGLGRIFDQLREEFDFIIVDSHPVLEATDSLLVAQQVDAVILSVLRDVSRMPPVYAAAQQLTDLGVRVLGAVVNGVNPQEVFSTGPHYPVAPAGRS